MEDRMITTALQYLNRYKWSVIPGGQDKKPLFSWKEYQERLPTEKEVRQWWKEHPEANIIVITGKISGLTVIDVDSDDGVEALDALLPSGWTTLTAVTQSGGQHYYCKYAEGTHNRARWITDCDIRSEGGYVVAPPSKGEKGVWEWLNSPEDGISPVPDEVLRRITKASLPENTGPAYKGLTFSKGTRDENMFSIANALIRGGMHEDDAKTVLEVLAKNCDPPFSHKETMIKLQSAINRESRGHGDIILQFRDWIEAGDGLFSLKDVQFDLGIVDRQGRKSLSNAANRLVQEGVITKTGKRGQFRIVDSNTEEINFLSASGDEIPFRWPLGIEKFFKLLPRNICVVAGEPDAGKTAYLLNVVRLNMSKHEIHYFSSEMGADEMRSRLGLFQPEVLLDQWKFKPQERDSNFADVIKPTAINIIDYLEIDGTEGREFWRVGGMLKDIRDRLTTGAAIVAIQKNRPKRNQEHNVGLGGNRGLEKPRLYITIGSWPNIIKLEKVKNWRKHDYNPNGLSLGFKLHKGCRFEAVGEWSRSL